MDKDHRPTHPSIPSYFQDPHWILVLVFMIHHHGGCLSNDILKISSYSFVNKMHCNLSQFNLWGDCIILPCKSKIWNMLDRSTAMITVVGLWQIMDVTFEKRLWRLVVNICNPINCDIILIRKYIIVVPCDSKIQNLLVHLTTMIINAVNCNIILLRNESSRLIRFRICWFMQWPRFLNQLAMICDHKVCVM